MLLVLVMVFSMVPQAAFADEIVSEEVAPVAEKAEYVYNYASISVGSNSITLDPSAVTTIYAFDAPEDGKYSFTASGAVIGYWGGNEWFLSNQGGSTGSYERECIVGPTYFIGVSGVDSCVLTVTKTGEKRPDPVVTEYQVVGAPNAAKMACYTVGEGDVTVVNFASTTGVSLNDVLGAPTNIRIKADNGYDYIDYRPALQAYANAAAASGGYYLLTSELSMILNDLYTAMGWSGFMSSVSALYEKASATHTAGDAVVENGNSNVYCTVCSALISSTVEEGPCTHKNLQHVEESCYNIEHWYCEECQVWWQDAELTKITNSKSVIKAVASHDLTHVEESCYNTEYWTCSICEIYWADEALTRTPTPRMSSRLFPAMRLSMLQNPATMLSTGSARLATLGLLTRL